MNDWIKKMLDLHSIAWFVDHSDGRVIACGRFSTAHYIEYFTPQSKADLWAWLGY